ncbi:MAG: hypothetical protein IIC21_08285 [Chloroflexi bacterium]|nr:hypothetical protein [Chloroflexota bacterium]
MTTTDTTTKRVKIGRRPRATARDVMEILGPAYGPVEWIPRYNPAEELVYTILSQHTSDLNSERAFNNLMKTFGTLEAIGEARYHDGPQD